jgi:hypothetical protein
MKSLRLAAVFNRQKLLGSLRGELINSYSTLVTVKSPAMEAMAKRVSRLFYRPKIALEGVDALEKGILETKPTVLVFGGNNIGAHTLEMWRDLFSESKTALTIIRRGTCTTAIDVKVAQELGIKVVNTPGVNSNGVAQNTYDALHKFKIAKSDLGLIGFGQIGRKLATLALQDEMKVVAYSPALHSAYQKNILEFNGTDLTKIHVASSIEEVIAKSSEIVVCVTLGQYSDGSVISADMVRSLNPESAVICITEPEVFSKDALRELVKISDEKKVRILFDNAAHAMKKLEEEIIEYGGKKENFTFQSNMMSSVECQRDMDIAVAALLIQNAIATKLPEIYRDVKECEFQIDSKNQKVTIVGAGISSMIAALYFQENGYEIEILEKDLRESAQGITRRGADARHISISETITHATSKRMVDWLFHKITNSNFFEQLFTEQFKTIGDNEQLVSLLQSVVASINKEAIQGEFGWQYLREKYPDIFSENIFGSGKILRVFSSEEELRKAYKFQSSIHDKKDAAVANQHFQKYESLDVKIVDLRQSQDEVRILEPKEIAEKIPALKHLVDEGKIVGAVEVLGYRVKILQVCKAIEEYLYEQSGVKVSWGQEVKYEEGAFVCSSNDEKRELTKEIPLIISSGVSPILEQDRDIQRVYGLFISIPNCGLTEAFKLHAKDPLGVINITPSEDGKLHISGGFQYFGSREATEKDLQELFEKLEKKIEEIFPDSYAKAIADGKLERKFCPRPMTSHGFPKFIKFDGGVSFGGTNSGGTVESTILGQLALLQTQYDENLFKADCELDEAIKYVLEVTRECLNYLGSAITLKQGDIPPDTTQSIASAKMVASAIQNRQ